MICKQDLKRIDDVLWEVPQGFRGDMRVPARLYADETLLEDALHDKSVDQLINTATLPGVTRYAIAMPDIHQGYGMPVGGVIATRIPDGVISPGAVGYDINCGVRLLASHVSEDEIRPHLKELANALYRNCPSGVGSEGSVPLKGEQLDQVLETGAQWALRKGYAFPEDLEHTEEFGKLSSADASLVSKRAKERGREQLGTLGAGNHFIEVDRVADVFDEEGGDRLGLFPGQVVTQIHCGSRGLGHQVCTDYVNRFQEVVREYHIELPDRELVCAPFDSPAGQLPDRELVCAPFDSPAGQDYHRAMACAANFAFANRQVLAYHIRRSFEETLAGAGLDFDRRIDRISS
ncbi:MAG: RtcB family protein, partial [Chloroflexi bacterium]|nr:RtcB family protein [Chloroflexota bacterium]